jgi:hypothetical protein
MLLKAVKKDPSSDLKTSSRIDPSMMASSTALSNLSANSVVKMVKYYGSISPKNTSIALADLNLDKKWYTSLELFLSKKARTSSGVNEFTFFIASAGLNSYLSVWTS